MGMEDYPRNIMEFEKRFNSEQECRKYLFKLRWLGGFLKKEIAEILKRSTTAIYRKGEKLGLPRRHSSSHPMKTGPREMAPIQGIRKCHNCLEEIKLSKNGLDKDYRGATRQNKWFFWHLPGKCLKDPNIHANLLEKDLPSDDDPGRFY